MLKQINEFDSSENPLTLYHSTIPNASITILDYIITNFLDNERPVVNLGAYTGRDLNYLLPICKKNNKEIECVESFLPITSQIKKQQLIDEIEAAYTSSLLKWTWKDASESEYLRSADYVYFSTDYSFPIEKYILATNHPCVWATSNPTWIWPRLGQAFHNEQIFTLLCHQITIFTNSLEIKEKFYEAIPLLNKRIQKWKYSLEFAGEMYKLRNSHHKDGMTQQWNFINKL